MRKHLWQASVFGLALTTAVAFAIGCDNEEGDGGATSTAPIEQATATPTEAAPAATAVPTASQEIRQEDLTAQPGVQEVIQGGGAMRTLNEPLYVDLTGDGMEEAVVTVASGGTAGDLAAFVFGYIDGQLTELLAEVPAFDDSSYAGYGGHVGATVESGPLITEWPVYRDGDANCCPSGGRHFRYYRWDGTKFVLDREETMPQGQQQ